MKDRGAVYMIVVCVGTEWTSLFQVDVSNFSEGHL